MFRQGWKDLLQKGLCKVMPSKSDAIDSEVFLESLSIIGGSVYLVKIGLEVGHYHCFPPSALHAILTNQIPLASLLTYIVHHHN